MCTWSNLEVILHPTLISVIHHGDAGVEVRILDAAEVGNVSFPVAGIISNQIVAFASQFLQSNRHNVSLSAQQLYSERGSSDCREWPASGRQAENKLVRSQEQAVIPHSPSKS